MLANPQKLETCRGRLAEYGERLGLARRMNRLALRNRHGRAGGHPRHQAVVLLPATILGL
jgi:hypothetical protein